MFIRLISQKIIMDEVKANTILTALPGIILLGMIGSIDIMIKQNRTYPFLWYLVFTMILYFFIPNALSRRMIVNRNKGGTNDLDEFFYKKEGKYIYDYNKMLEFRDKDLISRLNISQSDRDSIHKFLLIASLITPVMGWIILQFSVANQSDLDMLVFVLVFFYIAFFVLNIVLFFTMRFERKNYIDFGTKFIKLENSLRIKSRIMPMALVKNTEKKFLIMDLPLDKLNELTISSAYTEALKNIDKKHILIRFSLKLSRIMLKYPSALKLDLINSSVNIVEQPEYRKVRFMNNTKKSSVFVGCKNYELLDQIRTHIIAWAKN